MPFATFVLEKDPLQWSDAPNLILSWVEVVGSIAAVTLLLWFIVTLIRSRAAAGLDTARPAFGRLFTLCLMVAALGYLSALILKLMEASRESPAPAAKAATTTALPNTPIDYALAVGGLAALIAVFVPFLGDLIKLRGRRIWALARLSFKEAIRRKTLWAFSILLLVFLFASWFIDYKAENQVRNYVRVIYWAMTPLLLVTAGLLAAFSIPADIKSQTIHTIVTKPVERFEIVVGRFLGYTILMTAVMLVMTAVSLLYMLREINPEAKFESLRARVPVFGDLRFKGTTEEKGDSVGREWDYRRFIAGGPNSPQRAIFSFRDLPADLARRSGEVPCEFNFDVFRTTKGEEGKGVFCTLAFQTWHYDDSKANEYQQERERERNQGAATAAVDAQLAEKYGYYVIRAKQIFDYHTQAVQVPAALFKNAFQDLDKRPADPTMPGQKVPALQIWVKLESPSQYIGMAKYDLYLLDAERSFGMNFFKGAMGLWLRLCLVIGMAVTLSTYLSGIISFLTTMILFLLGYFQDFIQSLAQGTSVGGGPMESFVRLVKHENQIKQLDETAGAQLALFSDYLFRGLFRVLMAIIPDVDQFDFTDHVAEGFNIGSQQMGISLLVLVGYLVPCALLAYYLLKSREVAA
jgi:ABC-type transport system involved in multi-copper enzyme maturation permease subunit